METRRLRQAPNEARASAAEEWLADALDDTCQFKRCFLSAQGWLVIPVESGQHFTETDAERISKAATFLGEANLRAVLLEKVKDVRNHLEVDATKEALLLFSRECAHFNFALVPESRSFAVICTTQDYYLVAGSKGFVEAAVGKTVAEARAEFKDFACDDSWKPADKDRLVEAFVRYEEA